MINNSYDAFMLKGTIKLRLNENESFHTITLWDNGRGMMEKDLKTVFDKGVSLKGSSGLGLHHSKRTIEKLGGSIRVESSLGKWTQFTINLPKVSRPSWFVSEVNLSDIDSVVIIDDEQINFEEWQVRLARQSLKDLTYISNREQLSTYLKNIDKNTKTLFVVDYIFKVNSYTGIDLIKEFRLENCFVSTNKLKGSEIYTLCRNEGLKILPKHMVSRVPISYTPQLSVEEVDAVFLDDDKNISYMAEDLKETYGLSAKVFNSPRDFLHKIGTFSKDTLIFIDKNLGTTSGIEVARELHSRGIKNIIASSGSTIDSFGEKDKKLFKGFVHKLKDTQEFAAVISGEKIASW